MRNFNKNANFFHKKLNILTDCFYIYMIYKNNALFNDMKLISNFLKHTLTYKFINIFYTAYKYNKDYETISDTLYSEAFKTVLRRYLNVEFEKDWIGRLWAVINPNINIDGKIDFSNVIIELDGENTNSNEYVKTWVYKQMLLIGELFKIEKLYDYIYIDFKHVGPVDQDNYLIVFDMSSRIDFVENLKSFGKHSILYMILAAIVWLII